MRQVLLAAALAAVLPSAASAAPSLALRLGYESSSGSATTGTSMSEVAKADFPLQLDASWRFGPHFSMGVYYSFAIGQLSRAVSNRCDAYQASCSMWEMRVGIRGEYAFAEVSQRFVPWIGVGSGWEWVRASVSAPRDSASDLVSGWEWVTLEGGGDVRVAPKLWIGPYLGWRFGRYGRLNGFSIENQADHSWLGVGVRGRWDF
ncbi:MAG TPA: hypothetical protein VF841_17135 [Anaeromyxobacter sp.]